MCKPQQKGFDQVIPLVFPTNESGEISSVESHNMSGIFIQVRLRQNMDQRSIDKAIYDTVSHPNPGRQPRVVVILQIGSGRFPGNRGNSVQVVSSGEILSEENRRKHKTPRQSRTDHTLRDGGEEDSGEFPVLLVQLEGFKLMRMGGEDSVDAEIKERLLEFLQQSSFISTHVEAFRGVIGDAKLLSCDLYRKLEMFTAIQADSRVLDRDGEVEFQGTRLQRGVFEEIARHGFVGTGGN
jgi:hypothetical protein